MKLIKNEEPFEKYTGTTHSRLIGPVEAEVRVYKQPIDNPYLNVFLSHIDADIREIPADFPDELKDRVEIDIDVVNKSRLVDTELDALSRAVKRICKAMAKAV